MTLVFHPSQAAGTSPVAPEAAAKSGRRERHDAFTDARKHAFLKALIKTGCVSDAARAVGIAPKTVYRHQESDRRFAHDCRTALRMAATPLELTAWSRAVEGVEREFACGGQVHTRRIYSDSLLRLLLQGSNPKKYGARPGFTRKRLAKAERRQMEREVRAELAARTERWTFEESIEALDRGLVAFGVRDEAERLAEGWTQTANGDWVPPGYGWVGLPGLPGGPAVKPPGESM